VQFGFAQRDDLMVSFTEPTSARAAQELAALPGVRRVEPFRAAAVRLHAGHRNYRTALQGLPPQADLKRVLDQDLQPIAPPADGIMLTDYLADLLHVRPGDVLEVEFLEGHRRTLRVPLAGVVSEYLGVIESFHDTMAQNILIFTLISTLMAASIAVGVVYNTARITLAERGRELASLRVLGYTRNEVRALLFGELATLSFFALLPGFALGYGMAALLVTGFQSDLYRIALVFTPAGFAIAGLVVLAATLVSGLLVRRRLDRLDLVAVLKTKE
jgi:putative ABC transport system permease protein